MDLMHAGNEERVDMYDTDRRDRAIAVRANEDIGLEAASNVDFSRDYRSGGVDLSAKIDCRRRTEGSE
jgi:hypothetical protein